MVRIHDFSLATNNGIKNYITGTSTVIHTRMFREGRCSLVLEMLVPGSYPYTESAPEGRMHPVLGSTDAHYNLTSKHIRRCISTIKKRHSAIAKHGTLHITGVHWTSKVAILRVHTIMFKLCISINVFVQHSKFDCLFFHCSNICFM